MGDNHLGGGNIDSCIVDEVLIPALKRQRRIEGLARGNPKYVGAIAKLAQGAEEAKIRLSREETTEIIIDNLCDDDAGDRVTFEFELKRADVERLRRVRL